MLDIDIGLLRSALTAGFGREVSQSANLEATRATSLPSTGGGTFNTVVQRLSGSAEDAPWSVVVKQLTADPTRADWDRELSVCADAAWVASALPDQLRAPVLLASDRSDNTLILVFEDLRPAGATSTTGLATTELEAAARLLSELNATATEPRPWWSTDFLVREFHELSNHPERLAEARPNSDHEQIRQHLVALLDQAPRHLALVDSLPQRFAHLDAYSRNITVDQTGGTIGLVDWANAGAAPLGSDPATLFVLTLNYLDVDASHLNDLEAAVITAMHAGLLDAGAGSAIEQATEGFRAVARLRHLAMMMNALPMIEASDPVVSAIVGKPLDEIVGQWLAVGAHLLSN